MKATIIILAYKHERFIGDALDAIAMQTRQADEIIIVDDASPDATPDLVEAFMRAHPMLPIRFLRNSSNLGLSASFARAVEAATGDIIISTAGDDISMPERLERCLDYMANSPATYGVITDAEIIDDNSQRIGRLDNCCGAEKPVSLNLDDLRPGEHFLRGRSSCGAAAAYRAAVFREFSPLRSGLYSEDDPAAFRAMLLGGCDFLPIQLTRWRRHGNNLSYGLGNHRGPEMAVHYRRCEATIDQMLCDAAERIAKHSKAIPGLTNALANLRLQKAKWSLWAAAHEAGISLSRFLGSALELRSQSPSTLSFLAMVLRPLVGMLTPYSIQRLLVSRRHNP